MKINASPHILSLLLVSLANASAWAQTGGLPPTSRTAYKCEIGGKISYSDAPCVGAKRVDLEPTRGLNKSSGTERMGRDVVQERQNEMLAEAVKPITGMNPAQFEVEKRRVYLPAAVKAECKGLDRRMAEAEGLERQASAQEKGNVQIALFKMRARFQELRC